MASSDKAPTPSPPSPTRSPQQEPPKAPTPPPLPPTRASQQEPPKPPPLPPARPRQERPSAYLASLEAAGPNFMEKAWDGSHIQPEPHRPIFYFFYGTLTKPEVLKHILDLKEEPVLRPAKVVGYDITSWGQYPALIDGDTEVKGYAYEVQTVEDEYKLARYETSAYKVAPCRVRFVEKEDPSDPP